MADTSTSGLDYYNARYYDPVLGQFASADTKQGPNRYAYVAGNPETLTDPTGHRICESGDPHNCGAPPPPPSSGPPPGVYVVSDTTSGPITNTTTNSDYSTTITTVLYETLTYSDGTKRTISHTSSRTTCDATCQQKQAAQRVANAQADATKEAAEIATANAAVVLLGAVIGAIAIFLASSVFGILMAAAIVASGLIPLLGVLSGELTLLSQAFTDEQAYHPDAARWTVANVANYGQSLSEALGAINLGIAGIARGIMDIPGLNTMISGEVASGLAGGAGLSMLIGTQAIQEGIGNEEADLEGTRNGPS